MKIIVENTVEFISNLNYSINNRTDEVKKLEFYSEIIRKRLLDIVYSSKDLHIGGSVYLVRKWQFRASSLYGTSNHLQLTLN